MKPWVILFFVVVAFAARENETSVDERPLNIYIATVFHRTHWSFQVELGRELARRGHHVTIQLAEEYEGAGENPPRELIDFAHEIRLVPIGFTPEEMQRLCRMVSELSVTDFYSLYRFAKEALSQTIAEGWKNTYHALIAEAHHQPLDLVLSDLSPDVLGACEALASQGTSCVWTSPFVLRNPGTEFFLFNENIFPSWMPATAVGHSLATTWWERLVQQIVVNLAQSLNQVMSYGSVGVIRQAMEEDGYHTDFRSRFPVLVNSFLGLDWNIPLPPHVRYIGPVHLPWIEERIAQARANQQQQEALLSTLDPSTLDYFLHTNEQIVVVSFGKSVELLASQAEAIIELVEQLAPVPVLWTLRERHFHFLPPPEKRPSTLRVEAWVDLVGVLSHPHTQLLVSQCGVATAHEGLLTSTPLLCIPFLFDQFDIGVLVEHHHLGEVVHKESLAPGQSLLFDTVHFMLQHVTEYQQAAQRMKQWAHQAPTTEEVADWLVLLAKEGTEWIAPSTPAMSLHPYNLFSFIPYYELFYFMYGLVLLAMPWLLCRLSINR